MSYIPLNACGLSKRFPRTRFCICMCEFARTRACAHTHTRTHTCTYTHSAKAQSKHSQTPTENKKKLSRLALSLMSARRGHVPPFISVDGYAWGRHAQVQSSFVRVCTRICICTHVYSVLMNLCVRLCEHLRPSFPSFSHSLTSPLSFSLPPSRPLPLPLSPPHPHSLCAREREGVRGSRCLPLSRPVFLSIFLQVCAPPPLSLALAC